MASFGTKALASYLSEGESVDYEVGNTGANAVRRGGYGHSSYGSSGSYGHKKFECCELVVDPLAFLSILGGIAGGTAFLNVAITMNITMRRRRRKRQAADKHAGNVTEYFGDAVMQGRPRKIYPQTTSKS